MTRIGYWSRTIGVVAVCAFALLGVMDRSARTQFSQNTFMGTSGGTANAQTITIQNITALAEIINQPIWFKIGGGRSNTGALTLNINSIGAQNVYRTVPAGLAALGGGEVLAAQLVSVVWDGTQFQLLTSARPEAPGFVMDYAGSSCPTGFVAATSQTYSQASYPALYAVLGSTWGSNSGGNFTTPDFRGRTLFGIDVSVGGLANRITVAGGTFDGTVLANTGGLQNQTLSVSQIPTITPAGTNTVLLGAGTGTYIGTNGLNNDLTLGSGGGTFAARPITVTFTGTPFGGGLSHPILSPAAIVNKCVRT